MEFSPPLVRATLLRRYKRFLADVTLEDGREVTAHCANPGAMTGLAQAGTCVWLQPVDAPGRKLKFSWKLAETGAGLAVIDTGLANRVVEEALRAGRIATLAELPEIRREVRYGDGNRVDFLLEGPGGAKTYLEVKSVTLRRAPGLAEFPDTTTARGARHLHALADMARAGHRAVLLYVVQRTDCDRFALAADIDPAYAAAAAEAKAAGVETLCRVADIDTDAVTLGGALPIGRTA